MKIIKEYKRYRIVQKMIQTTWGWGFTGPKEMLFVVQEKINKKFLFWSWVSWSDAYDCDDYNPTRGGTYGYFRTLDHIQKFVNKLREKDLVAFS